METKVVLKCRICGKPIGQMKFFHINHGECIPVATATVEHIY